MAKLQYDQSVFVLLVVICWIECSNALVCGNATICEEPGECCGAKNMCCCIRTTSEFSQECNISLSAFPWYVITVIVIVIPLLVYVLYVFRPCKKQNNYTVINGQNVEVVNSEAGNTPHS